MNFGSTILKLSPAAQVNPNDMMDESMIMKKMKKGDVITHFPPAKIYHTGKLTYMGCSATALPIWPNFSSTL